MERQLQLTAQEMQTVRRIAASCDQSVASLCHRLEALTWEDGLLEFRMQGSVGLLPWMEQLVALSDRVNRRLRHSGIPLGPSLAAYQTWLSQSQS